MANPFLPLSLAATLVAGLTYGMVNSPETHSTASTAYDLATHKDTAKVWMIRDTSTDDICLIEKRRRVSATTSTLKVDSACDTVLPTGYRISSWQQDNLGNVTLADEQGKSVIDFQNTTDGDLIASTGKAGKIVLSPGS